MHGGKRLNGWICAAFGQADTATVLRVPDTAQFSPASAPEAFATPHDAAVGEHVTTGVPGPVPQSRP
jgi:hypothetical protein